MPSTRPSPAGSLGDHAATRGDTPVSRMPSRNMTTATASTSTPVTRVGRLIVEPEGAEQRAEDAEADDASGVEGELGPHPRRERQSCPAAGGVGGGVRGGETEHQASDHGHAGRHAGGDTQDEHEEQAAAARVGHPRREVGRAEDGERRGERRHGQRRDRHGSPDRPVAAQPGCGAWFVAGRADGGVEQDAVQGRVTAHGRRAASGRHAHGPHAGHCPERLGDPPLTGGARHPRDGNGERNGGAHAGPRAHGLPPVACLQDPSSLLGSR